MNDTARTEYKSTDAKTVQSTKGILWLPGGPDDRRKFDPFDPCMWTMLAALVCVVAIATLRTDARFAGSPNWYWVAKIASASDANLVIAGDSRTYRGIDPEAFVDIAGGKVLNFGFSSTHLTQTYLEHAASFLRADGPRVLLVGITPTSLRPSALEPDGYTDGVAIAKTQRLPLPLARLLESWQELVDPVALELIWPGTSGRIGLRARAEEYAQVFHPNGWIESDRYVADPVSAGLLNAAMDFSDKKIPGDAEVQQLCSTLKQIAQSGISVYVFLPPVDPVVHQEEIRLSGINEQQLRLMVESAGAHWVDIHLEGLRIYDGSHLDGPSARRYSVALAKEIHLLQTK